MVTRSPAASSRSEIAAFSVGLTGGIGSGKSAVAALFAQLGAGIVDSDAIAHALAAPGGAAIDALAEAFGRHYIGADGALDRARMRELVFRDTAAKTRLEALLHPLIRSQALAQAQRLAATAPYVIFVVPLLVESGNWRSRVDRLLVVDCAEATQLERVVARSGLDPAEVRSMIASQASRAQRLDAADDILVNDGPLAPLVPRVQRLHRSYCSYARRAQPL